MVIAARVGPSAESLSMINLLFVSFQPPSFTWGFHIGNPGQLIISRQACIQGYVGDSDLLKIYFLFRQKLFDWPGFPFFFNTGKSIWIIWQKLKLWKSCWSCYRPTGTWISCCFWMKRTWRRCSLPSGKEWSGVSRPLYCMGMELAWQSCEFAMQTIKVATGNCIEKSNLAELESVSHFAHGK